VIVALALPDGYQLISLAKGTGVTMKRAALALAPVILLVSFVSAQTPETQSGASVWDVLAAPTMDPEKSAVAENADIVRDRVHITLVSGALQFAKPGERGRFCSRISRGG
jgi:hypothetical protein